MKKTVWVACQDLRSRDGVMVYCNVGAYSPTEMRRLLSMDYRPLYKINVYPR